MGEAQELKLNITVHEAGNQYSPEHVNVPHQSTAHQLREHKWWLRLAIYALFLLSGQSIATLLGRLYFEKGGKSMWMGTLVQLAGFPILLPLFYILPPKIPATSSRQSNQPSVLINASIYVALGLLVAAGCTMFSVGLQYLPVSTFSLISATQLAFNAFFSYFLNSQKFTPFIINSLVLLTISPILLIFQTDSGNSTETSRGKYVVGFLCAVGGSAGYALMLSLTQLSFKKVFRGETFTVILNMIIYQSLVATCAVLVGLFASGDWKSLKIEMADFELGKVSYVMILAWTAVLWQVFSIGVVGLIFEVSSLFSNVIGTLGLPIVPALAVIFFHEKMNGVKVVSMLLAIWGFASYIYQHYLDDFKSKAEGENVSQVAQASVAIYLAANN